MTTYRLKHLKSVGRLVTSPLNSRRTCNEKPAINGIQRDQRLTHFPGWSWPMSAATLRAMRKFLLASIRVTRFDARRRDEAPRYMTMAREVQRQLVELRLGDQEVRP
jgi:hypothetical protein